METLTKPYRDFADFLHKVFPSKSKKYPLTQASPALIAMAPKVGAVVLTAITGLSARNMQPVENR
jgi:hypothetical protein